MPETQKETTNATQGNDVHCEEAPKLIILVVASQHDEATELEKSPVIEATSGEKKLERSIKYDCSTYLPR